MADFSSLKEQVLHRSGSLPLKIYSETYVNYHWHDEIEFIIGGEDTALCCVNGESTELKKNQAMLVHSGECHSIATNGTSPITAIVFSPSLISDRLTDSLFSGKVRFKSLFTKDADTKIFSLFESVISCYNAAEFGYEFVLKTLLCQIFCHLLRDKSYSFSTADETHSKERDLFEFVHNHYAEPVTLSNITASTYYSKSYVIKLFKKHTSLTPIEYVIRYRLSKAKERLRSTDDSVLKIALSCGFKTPGYFIRSFHTHFGITPTQYRKSFR